MQASSPRTVAHANPVRDTRHPFPPPSPDKGKATARQIDDEEDEVRKAALEFMVSLSEAKPGMARHSEGWVAAIVRCCLEGMGELSDEETDMWLEADVSDLCIVVRRILISQF